MISDAWRSDNLKDKFTIWFKPTGWRPENFDDKYPVSKISDVYHFEKYGIGNSKTLLYWSVAQMLVTLVFVTYLFDNVAGIGLPNIFSYGLFIFITIYSYTELMDTRPFSVFWESLRFLFGIAVIVYFGDWFKLNAILPFGNYIIIGYLTISLFASAYFAIFEFSKQKPQLVNS
jgi:hypothetical protein